MTAHSAEVGIPFVVAAPSGTGKTTVCRAVVGRDGLIEFSVSHTTRPRRKAEVDGRDYHFVDDREFERLVEEDAFLEWAVYNSNRYGTSWQSIDQPLSEGRDVLLEIEVQGAGQVRARRKDARLIFLLPPSLGALRSRLEGRGTDSPQQIARRLEVAEGEIGAVTSFDYAVTNEDLECCVSDVLEIVRGERAGEVQSLRERFSPAAAAERFALGER